MAYQVKNQYGVVTVNEENARKEIRFIDPHYKELFRIPDGGSILYHKDGEIREIKCYYLDAYHFRTENGRAYHICEFGEMVENHHAFVEAFPEKRIIWSDLNLDLKDWIMDIHENYPELSRDEYEEKMYELNSDYLLDERENLSEKVGNILVIGDLGFWNGRRMGYKEIHDATIGDCLFYNYDGAEWYVSRDKELCGTEVHHDGTNYYRYRTYKENATEEDIDNLKGLLYKGKATEEDIDRVTNKLGERVAKVYGWNFPTVEEKAKEQQKER